MSTTSRPDGVTRIAKERKRQIEQEDYSPRHDRLHHRAGELARAAECYACCAAEQAEQDNAFDPRDADVPVFWPFGDGAWKPSDDPIRNLEKAGALIAAEIDRLLFEREGEQP